MRRSKKFAVVILLGMTGFLAAAAVASRPDRHDAAAHAAASGPHGP